MDLDSVFLLLVFCVCVICHFHWYHRSWLLCCFLEQSAAEKVKAKMKLQLDETGMLVGPFERLH